ncbi:MAG: N-acetylneuraminate synthase family protein [Candidatus Atribacteria bacterium]|nr:N-acetylneuraminate synthase family protein [Candidatus Atribacteria bacterium]
MLAQRLKIGNHWIGKEEPVFIIAEIGSNHDGSLEQAKKLIDACEKIKVDAVKFQSFSAEKLINQMKLDEKGNWIYNPAFKVIKSLELPTEWHKILFDYAANYGLIFLSSAFDLDKVDLLNSIGVPAFKIASGDINYIQLLKYVAKYKKPILLSTGAAYLGEIEEAIKIIQKEENNQIALLHCVSSYPPNFKDANIQAMLTMKKAFKAIVGYSDHSPGFTVPLGAVTLGAKIIEKHITFDRNLKGPDHSYALTVEEFDQMIKEIRNLEDALGNGVKEPVSGEISERVGARRSIYSVIKIHQGEKISPEMIKIVRHAYGLKPSEADKIIGRKAKVDIDANLPITWDVL